jgi:DNA-3-methyladenine glycosylase II
MSLVRLDHDHLARGVRLLTRRDPDLARVVQAYGPPPLWVRAPGFTTLVRIILEQQVSLASANAAFNRLKAAGPVTPRRFLEYDETTLRAMGFSRQKTAYAWHLAQAIVEGRFSVRALNQMGDAAARAALIALKGIGAWSADIYLLMALRRPDVWPSGDLALQAALQDVKRLPARPTPGEMDALAQGWKPWRAVAARILWHHYLSRHK